MHCSQQFNNAEVRFTGLLALGQHASRGSFKVNRPSLGSGCAKSQSSHLHPIRMHLRCLISATIKSILLRPHGAMEPIIKYMLDRDTAGTSRTRSRPNRVLANLIRSSGGLQPPFSAAPTRKGSRPHTLARRLFRGAAKTQQSLAAGPLPKC
jgi:hypothetical protein